MSDTVECPYCSYDNDMSDALCDGLSNDNTFDHECEKCGEEFEVYVEFEPSFSSSEIVYIDCERCGSYTRDAHIEGRVYPWPKAIKEKAICKTCWHVAMSEEYRGE